MDNRTYLVIERNIADDGTITSEEAVDTVECNLATIKAHVAARNKTLYDFGDHRNRRYGYKQAR